MTKTKTMGAVFACILAIFSLRSAPAHAEDTPTNRAYFNEQALVAQLSESGTFEDQRALAELLREGLIAGPNNPLRRSDRIAAAAAYRRAIALGDSSAATTVALARLLLRQNDASGLSELMPSLRSFMLQGNGDAAYVLALDAAQNRQMPIEQTTPMLEAAAVMGSVAAVLDLAGGGVKIGATVRASILDNMQQRAGDGWAPAAYALYQVFTEGTLVDRDPKLSMKWLRAAVDGGHQVAIERYAEHLQFGTDVPIDLIQAAALYRRAAEAGSSVAAMALGRAARSASAMAIGPEEGRLWLRRAAEIGIRGAAVDISSLDLGLALKLPGDPATKAQRIEKALEPIANDAEALADLARQHWRTEASSVIAPVLLPLLERQALSGSSTAGIAYDIWLRANGQPLPENVGRALVASMRKSPPTSIGFANFIIADLALDGRVGPDVVPKTEAMDLLFGAAKVSVGQAMLRLGQMYARGDQVARSVSFAKRWFLLAQAQAVERASWDLAALQVASDDPRERSVGTQFYLQKLDEGDPRGALALVGQKLRSGTVDPSTLARARAVASDPHEATNLARMLMTAGGSQNLEAAHAILRPLADKAYPEGLVAFGRLLILTSTSPEQAAKGFDLLQKAVTTGTAAAKVALASTYLSSVTYADHQDDAVRLLKEVLADNSRDPDARLLMSKAYLLGLGVARDPRQAARLVADIRAEGAFENPKATLLEADWLAFSSSRRDPQALVGLLKAQAARGSISAERALGETYLSGFGASLDPDTAATHLHRAAYSGDREAMAALGHMMLNGYGLNQSRDTGLHWMKRAAEAGDTAAMYELSRIYALGSVGEVNGQQALYWLQRAAERNDPNAAFQLGLAYLKGEWVASDLEKAQTWFERSASAGSLLAGRTLTIVRQQVEAGAQVDTSGAPDE